MTMNIQYLLDAAAFLEEQSHSGLPLDLQSSTVTWTAVNGFSSSSASSSSVSRGLFSSASGSSESSSSSSSRDGVEVSSTGGVPGGGGGRGASSTANGNNNNNNDASEPKILRRFKGKNSRETHNRLEKDRRAYLRECFANLRRVVDIDDPKTSNLAILQSAIRCIQSLKRQEKQYEQETASLAKRKIELQQKIGELKRDLSDRNPDPSFDVNLWLKMHVNNASSSSSAAAAAAATCTDASSDEAASVHAWSYADGNHHHHRQERRRNLSHSPQGGGRESTTVKKDAADAESTSTVSLDENSKEPIFSDEEGPARRHVDGVTYRFADVPSVAANIAVDLDADAPTFASNGEDAAYAATATDVLRRVGGEEASSGRFETVIDREDGEPRGEVVAESSQVLTHAGQNVAFMTPDGKIILADDHHQLIRTGGSNFLILQPSGYASYDVLRDQTAHHHEGVGKLT